MKYAIFPHCFKRIGLACFFVASAFILTASTIYPLTINTSSIGHLGYFDESAYEAGYAFGSFFFRSLIGLNDHFWLFRLCSILLVLGIAFYMLAKEKEEDDYLAMLRWESVRLSILISVVVTLLFIILGSVVTARALLFILFTSYLIMFKVKRSNYITE